MDEKNTINNFSIPQETISWLLSSQTPSIRYLTLTNVLHKPLNDPEVSEVRALIPTSKPVSAIFARQDPEGFWVKKKHHYSPKYRSSHWTMILLTELAVHPDHPQMQSGADFMLNKASSEYHLHLSEAQIGFGCFWGNWLRYELYCGKFNDPSVQHVIDLTCADILRLGKCKYNVDLPCAWAVVRDLYGLALIPSEQRSADVEKAIQRGIQFLLEDYDLLRANYPVNEKPHPLWFSLSYPIFYHADVLLVLRILKELNALDHPQASPAIQWLKDKQTLKGTWSGGSPFRKRTRPFLVAPDTPNHWITLHAASILS